MKYWQCAQALYFSLAAKVGLILPKEQIVQVHVSFERMWCLWTRKRDKGIYFWTVSVSLHGKSESTSRMDHKSANTWWFPAMAWITFEEKGITKGLEIIYGVSLLPYTIKYGRPNFKVEAVIQRLQGRQFWKL